MHHDVPARDTLLPLAFRELVDEAVQLTKRHFVRIYLPVVIPLVLLNASILVLQTLFLEEMDPADPLSFMIPGCGATVVFTGVTLVAYTAMEAATVEAVIGRQVSMRRCWWFAVQPRVFGTLVLLFLLVGLGAVLFVLPGLYLLLLFSFTVQIMVTEGTFGSSALGRSRRIATFNPKKNFLSNPLTKILAIWVIGLAIGWGLSLLVTFPFQIAIGASVIDQTLEQPDAMVVAPLWLSLPSNLLQTLASSAAQLYLFFAMSLLYWDTRRRHEAWDLEAAIDEIAAAKR